MDFRHVILFAILLAIPAVSAAGNQYGNQLLVPALAQVACKTDFMTALISSTVADGPNASSLSTYATKLQSDQTQLQTYETSGDVSSFRSYVHSTYDPDFASARNAIVSWRVSERKDLTNDTRTKLKDDYQSLSTTFQSCHLNAVKSYADAKVSIYNDELSTYQGRIANLSAKGVDTSTLSSLVSEAQSQIVTPLQNAINSATDAKGVTQALGQYCLYDGCKSGTNFHFAAKFEITRLGLILDKLQVNATSGSAASDVTNARNDLNTAQSALNSVGSAQYGPGQSDQVWNPIQAAANALKQLLKDLEGSS